MLPPRCSVASRNHRSHSKAPSTSQCPYHRGPFSGPPFNSLKIHHRKESETVRRKKMQRELRQQIDDLQQRFAAQAAAVAGTQDALSPLRTPNGEVDAQLLDLSHPFINPVYQTLAFQIATSRTRLAALERQEREMAVVRQSLGAIDLVKQSAICTAGLPSSGAAPDQSGSGETGLRGSHGPLRAEPGGIGGQHGAVANRRRGGNAREPGLAETRTSRGAGSHDRLGNRRPLCLCVGHARPSCVTCSALPPHRGKALG